MDGLVHLSLGPQAFRARDVSLRLEDFELRIEEGTLFSTPEALGPTAFVFVGRGGVRFSPAPPAEREQLRQFGGATSLDRAVGWAFIRLHPTDFHRVLETGKLEPEDAPGGAPGGGAAHLPGAVAEASRSTPASPAPPGGSCRAWATRWWTSRGGGSGC